MIFVMGFLCGILATAIIVLIIFLSPIRSNRGNGKVPNMPNIPPPPASANDMPNMASSGRYGSHRFGVPLEWKR